MQLCSHARVAVRSAARSHRFAAAPATNGCHRINMLAASGRVVGPVTLDPPRVLLFDVMDTIVYDPFFKDMPQFFGMSFQELLQAKHPTAWIDFECNRIDEAELCRIFFADGRAVDYDGLLAMLRYLDGMEALLSRLFAAGVEMHALSNYPVWYRLIEEELRLSRYLPWTFLSCTGPLEGVRKPAPEAYRRVVSHLGLPASQLLFIDDRQANVDGAIAEGVRALRFTGAQQLESDLRTAGLHF